MYSSHNFLPDNLRLQVRPLFHMRTQTQSLRRFEGSLAKNCDGTICGGIQQPIRRVSKMVGKDTLLQPGLPTTRRDLRTHNDAGAIEWDENGYHLFIIKALVKKQRYQAWCNVYWHYFIENSFHIFVLHNKIANSVC